MKAMNKVAPMPNKMNNSKDHTWNKCTNPITQNTVSNKVSPKVKKVDKKAKVHTLNNPANILIDNCKSGGGNGPILL